MRSFEYEAKEVMGSYGLPVPANVLAVNFDEAIEAAGKIGLPVVLKAQVLVGGRGKAGGIKIASTPEEMASLTQQIFSLSIKGEKVTKILVEKKLDIKKEYFVAITIDRSEGKPVALASSMGGMDIEDAARLHPEAIVKLHIDPRFGIYTFQARKIGQQLDLKGEQILRFADILTKLYKIYDNLDAELVETNPLVLTQNGELILADARLNLIDDALFRHKDFQERALRRLPESTQLEGLAKSRGVTLVDLGGDIAVLGNGAGLTMATIDVVLHYGGKPACFLDIGGGATPEEFARSLSPLVEYPRVKAILVNILGGITKCDDIANGIKKVSREMKINKPLIVRLSGTNEKEGQSILNEINFKAFTSMNEAVMEVIRAAGGM